MNSQLEGPATNAHQLAIDFPLESYTIKELKERLAERGLIKSGKKADLVDRLWNYLNANKLIPFSSNDDESDSDKGNCENSDPQRDSNLILDRDGDGGLRGAVKGKHTGVGAVLKEEVSAVVRSGVGRTADGKRVQIGRQASRTFGMLLPLLQKSMRASLPRKNIFSDILNPRAVLRVEQRGVEKQRSAPIYQTEVGNWAMKMRCNALNKKKNKSSRLETGTINGADQADRSQTEAEAASSQKC